MGGPLPFVDGDAEDSWEMYPPTLQSTQAWLDLFRRDHIRWVVRDPDYPDEFARALAQLENEGILKPCASGVVQDIEGFRINGQLINVPVTILCVAR